MKKYMKECGLLEEKEDFGKLETILEDCYQ